MISLAKQSTMQVFAWLLLTASLMAGCSDQAPANPPVKLSIVVTVTPVTSSITTRQTQQFTVTLTNASNTAVTWKVDDVEGGNANVGMISSAGLYKPSSHAATRNISATSVEDPTKTASATITVQREVVPVPITLSITPVTASINTRQTQQYTATLTNATNTAVTWKVDGVDGGNADVGTISDAGLYTPSAQATTRIISATSVEDPAKMATATLTVQLEVVPVALTLSVTPVTASINTLQTQQFTATLTNASNTTVIWKVDGVEGGNADVGTISSAGLYTPSSQAATHNISATSVEDPTKTASATLAVQLDGSPGVLTISVTPETATINTLQTQQFTATLTNASNPAVTWKVDDVEGGNADVGVISATGLYTPSPQAATRVISATSVEDPTKTASATLTIQLEVVPGALTLNVTPVTAWNNFRPPMTDKLCSQYRGHSHCSVRRPIGLL